VSQWMHNTGVHWCEEISKRSRSKYIKDWKPIRYEPIAQMCESGNHVPFTDDLISFLSHLVPASDYILSSFIDIPRFYSDPKFFYKKIYKELQTTKNIPSYNLPGIVRGTISFDPQHPNIRYQTGWFFNNLQLVAIPLHSVWDKFRVEYYKKRMMENNNLKRNFQGIDFDSENMDILSTLQSHMHLQEYIPTVIILSPDIGREWYALGGIVIDGHQKLQAAAEIGSPVRVILVENKLHNGFYRKDCHCENCTSKKKGVPLAWASEKKKICERLDYNHKRI